MSQTRALFAILALALLLALAAAGTASAGAFSVVPQAVQLDATSRNGVVEVRNNAPEETLFQVETFAWIDGPALSDLKPTQELLAVPAVFRLAPGAAQTIRVAARGADTLAQTEKSYRLLISEVPQPGDRGGVVFALRMSLPVFLTPENAKARLDWSLSGAGRLVVKNSGSAHLRLVEVRVFAPASGQFLQTLPLEQPAYLLPGHQMGWPLSHGRDTAIRIEAETTGGTFQQLIGG